MTTLYIFTSLVIVFVISALWLATYLFRRAQELAPYYAEKATLEQDIATAKQNCSQTRLELDKLAASLAQAKQDIADAEYQRKWLQDNEGTVASLKGQIATTQQKLDDVTQKLDSKKGDLQQADSELMDKRAELNSIDFSRQSAENKLKEAQAEYKRLSEDIKARGAELQKKWEDLDRPIETINKAINIAGSKRYEEDGWLAKFENNLADNGFRFDSRLIKAFHTSLKVADCSPMVVLSGISGTGKSLLPELYAHAIGMNFLQVPVQPRWDSPQDMLGFYNYMEHRYKATELSRLLWQTDKYNNEQRAITNPVMNIILLDEMNLARVEYYFSDMLSKLEVRRGLDPSDEKKRRAAEIVLESGAAGGTGNIRRIFVGSHNLFVGTMNEDESTQTLSDKVKDRANVLRFGRPKELSGVAADKKSFFEKYTERMMTEEMWQEWQKPSGDRDIPDLGQKMDELNCLLAKLGRPFAHRMWNAVAAYIHQYPGSKQDAWIDQIEMKILPKLAGLDMADPSIVRVMDDLGSYLATLKEEKLNEAFSAACKRDFFAWQGIER